MSKEFKAVCTLIAGTIGVGFFAIPYSLFKSGFWIGIIVLFIGAFLVLITNIAYADIVVKDKGNRQLPGYAKKYLGRFSSYLVTIINILGNFGVLFAYAIISGVALHNVLTAFRLYVSANFLGLIFIILGLFVMKYGMQIIAKLSTLSILLLVSAIFILICIAVPKVNFDNAVPLNLKSLSLIFGVSIFAQYGAGSLPMLDELIGYNKKKFRIVVVFSSVITLAIYLLFGIVMVLAYGDKLTSEFVDSFNNSSYLIIIFFSIVTLLATFKSFVLIANNVKEILIYDYKLPQRISIFFILICLLILMIFQFVDFTNIISLVGKYSLALESLFIFWIWFKVHKTRNITYTIIVVLSAVILIAGILFR